MMFFSALMEESLHNALQELEYTRNWKNQLIEETQRLKCRMVSMRLFDEDGNPRIRAPMIEWTTGRPASRTVKRKDRRRKQNAHQKMENLQRAINQPVTKPREYRSRYYKSKFCSGCKLEHYTYCMRTCGHLYCDTCILKSAGVQKMSDVAYFICRQCPTPTRREFRRVYF